MAEEHEELVRLDEDEELEGDEEEEDEDGDEEEDEDEDGDEEEDEDEDEEEEEETHVPPEILAGWCAKCSGRCCSYYTIYLDDPEDADDFDEFRWFLAHGGCYIYVDEDQWHLNVESRCRFLGEKGRCAIYDHRPDVCRDFGHEEECEWTGDFDFEHTFKTLVELEAYARKVLEPEEFAKLPAFPEGWQGPS